MGLFSLIIMASFDKLILLPCAYLATKKIQNSLKKNISTLMPERDARQYFGLVWLATIFEHSLRSAHFTLGDFQIHTVADTFQSNCNALFKNF